MLITKRIDITTFMGYVIAQIMGGAIASVVAGMVVTPAIVGAGTPAVGAGLTSTGALIAEIVGTMFLVLTIFGAAVDKRNSGQAPIYIGLAIVGIILAVGPASGAALNPARYIGPAIVGGKFGPDFWVWIVGPLAGAAIAALLFEHFFFMNEPAAEA
jgi:aquaporin Z